MPPMVGLTLAHGFAMRKRSRCSDRAIAGDVSESVPSPEASTSESSTTSATCLATAALPTQHGQFTIAVYEVPSAGTEIAALTFGRANGELPLVRLHSECLTGDAFGSLRCDCGEQLDTALERIARSGHGVLLYLHQEGRGIGLANKIRAYALQEEGMDTVDANIALGLPVDGRDYRAAAAVLSALGMNRVRLLTNNPTKQRALESHDIRVMERVPLVMPPNNTNLAYLHTKASRMGHLLDLDEQAEPAVGDTEREDTQALSREVPDTLSLDMPPSRTECATREADAR